MKEYLSLTVHQPTCWDLANCLIGSPVKLDYSEHSVLASVSTRFHYRYFLMESREIEDGRTRPCIDEEVNILIPLDTLVFCPYTAMKLGVPVSGMSDGHVVRGAIDYMTKEQSHIRMGFSRHPVFTDHLQPDLENLPKGAEIVILEDSRVIEVIEEPPRDNRLDVVIDTMEDPTFLQSRVLTQVVKVVGRRGARVAKLKAFRDQDHESFKEMLGRLLFQVKDKHWLTESVFNLASSVGEEVPYTGSFRGSSFHLDGFVLSVNCGQGCYYSIERVGDV